MINSMSDFDKGWKGSRVDGPKTAEYKKGWDARQEHIDARVPQIKSGGGGCSTVLFIGALITSLVLAKLWT